MADDGKQTKLTGEELRRMMQAMRAGGDPQSADHKFWDTQPVPKLGEKIVDHGPIETKTLADVPQEAYNLPAGFEWCEVDMTDPMQVDQVYDLLAQNYVEDDDAMFRFDYSREFLRWALMPPGFRKEFHIAVRGIANKKLFGFITGIPAQIRVYEHVNPMVEINFLCVHKKLRAKRLGPVLIKEITRRVNLTGVWQAVYTAGALIPKPVAKNRYYHRSLNPKKLIEIGFSRLSAKMTLSATIKLYRLPTEPKATGLRPLTPADVPSACRLLNKYLAKFPLAPVYDEHDFAHWFLPRPDVISCYVVQDSVTKEITEMISFYNLPSTVLQNPKHNHLKAAYSYYHVNTNTTFQDLFNDALILASKEEFDVFNALDVMENTNVFKELKFGIGDGNLHYYLYNWKCPEMQAGDVGLVLL